MESVLKLWAGSGLANIAPGQVVMILVCLVLLYLAIRKGFFFDVLQHLRQRLTDGGQIGIHTFVVHASILKKDWSGEIT